MIKEYRVSIESHTPPLTLDQIKINKFISGNVYIYEQTRQILVVLITKNIHYKSQILIERYLVLRKGTSEQCWEGNSCFR